MSKSEFDITIYIKTTAEKLMDALTNSEMVKQYWFGATCESSWKEGAMWRLLYADGQVADAGTIVSYDPPKKLVINWRNEWNKDMKAEGPSLCTFQIEPADGAVKLTISHSMDRSGSTFIEAISIGWPKVLSNLKSLLETGKALWGTIQKIEDCKKKT